MWWWRLLNFGVGFKDRTGGMIWRQEDRRREERRSSGRRVSREKSRNKKRKLRRSLEIFE